MLQRIQTVYLALATILLVLCCCMPLARFEAAGMGPPSDMYSLMTLDGNGVTVSYKPAALFVITVCCEIATVCAIMGYRNRRSQMRLCTTAAMLELLWLVAYALLVMHLKGDNTWHITLAALFPPVAIVLTLMARRAIRKDEELVRSADRIR